MGALIQGELSKIYASRISFQFSSSMRSIDALPDLLVSSKLITRCQWMWFWKREQSEHSPNFPSAGSKDVISSKCMKNTRKCGFNPFNAPRRSPLQYCLLPPPQQSKRWAQEVYIGQFVIKIWCVFIWPPFKTCPSLPPAKTHVQSLSETCHIAFQKNDCHNLLRSRQMVSLCYISPLSLQIWPWPSILAVPLVMCWDCW